MGFLSAKLLPSCESMCVCCPALRPSSRRPVKRYKKLLAEIFPKTTVSIRAPRILLVASVRSARVWFWKFGSGIGWSPPQSLVALCDWICMLLLITFLIERSAEYCAVKSDVLLPNVILWIMQIRC